MNAQRIREIVIQKRQEAEEAGVGKDPEEVEHRIIEGIKPEVSTEVGDWTSRILDGFTLVEDHPPLPEFDDNYPEWQQDARAQAAEVYTQVILARLRPLLAVVDVVADPRNEE